MKRLGRTSSQTATQLLELQKKTGLQSQEPM